MFFSSWPREHISLRRRSFSVSDRNGPLLLSTVEQPAWAAWTLLSRRPLSTPWACLHPRAVQNSLRKNPANRPPVASIFFASLFQAYHTCSQSQGTRTIFFGDPYPKKNASGPALTFLC